MKKLLTLLLCLTMTLTMMPGMVFATDDNSGIFYVDDTAQTDFSAAVSAAKDSNGKTLEVRGDFKPTSDDLNALQNLNSELTLAITSNGTVTITDPAVYGTLLTNAENLSVRIDSTGSLILPDGTTTGVTSSSWFGGTGSKMTITDGSITISDLDKLASTNAGEYCTWTLSEDAKVEVPSGKEMNLQFTSTDSKTYGVKLAVPDGAELTVNGTLDAISGAEDTTNGNRKGSQIDLQGDISVGTGGALRIAQKAMATITNDGSLTVNSGGKLEVTKNEAQSNLVVENGTLSLPYSTKADLAAVGGTISLSKNAKFIYTIPNQTSIEVFGGTNPFLNLKEGTVELDFSQANDATNGVVGIKLTSGSAEVAKTDGLKALIVASDGNVPFAITIANGATVTIPSGKVLNLVNGSSLTNNGGTLNVAGTLEVHSKAVLTGETDVSGEVYVFDVENGDNPVSGAEFTLTKAGRIYTNDVVINNTDLESQSGSYSYTSISSGESTFTTEWKLKETVTPPSPSVPVAPTVQKPTVEADANATVTLSSDGTTATITVADGYELADVTLNGVSQGKVTTVTGLKTGDKLVVTTQKIVTPEEEEAAKNARLKAGVENTTIKLTSTLGKSFIKLNWKKSAGYKVDYYEVYKSTKRYKGYGTEPYFKTKQGGLTGWYKNTKELKKGTRYYYKVRGVRDIAGETVYTQWSTKAWRLVK